MPNSFMRRFIRCIFKEKPLLQLPFWMLLFSMLSLVDQVLMAPVLPLGDLARMSGTIESVEKIGLRWPSWKISVQTADGEVVWFDRTATTSLEDQAIAHAHGAKVDIWYQEEYSLFPKFYYRHVREMRRQGQSIFDYSWLWKNRSEYELRNIGKKFSIVYLIFAGAMLLVLIRSCELFGWKKHT